MNSQFAAAFSVNELSGAAVPWQDTSLPLMPSTPRQSLVVIDGAVAGIDALKAGITNADVLVLDTADDGIEQITAALAQYKSLASLHIVSHGQAGLLNLGTATLDGDTVIGYGGLLSQWQTALAPDADILLYGCNVAEGSVGQALVNQLAQLTGADMAASVDLTGSTALGGDWQLEYAQGEIDSELPFALSVLSDYGAVLNSPLRYEAETWALSANYAIESLSFASGGQGIRIKQDPNNNPASYPGSATRTFDGATGNYTIVAGFFDETDGVSEASFEINGQTLTTWEFNNSAGGNAASASNLRELTLGTDVLLTQGDSLTLRGQRDLGEFARFDYIDFIPTTGTTNSGVLSFAESAYQIDESTGELLVTVQRSGSSTGSVSATVTITGGDAQSNDIGAVPSTVTFADGVSTATIAIDIVDDNDAEPTETVELGLSSPTNGVSLGIPASTTISILDDDSSTPLVRYEVEDWTLSDNYNVENLSFASGGANTKIVYNSGAPATATTTFAEAAGTYNIVVGFFDENDGVSSGTFELNGQTLSTWLFDQSAGGNAAAASNLREVVVGTDVSLTPGDELKLIGTQGDGEMARFDYVEFIPSALVSLDGVLDKTPGETDQLIPTRFFWTDQNADFDNELGLFLVDDADGRIGSLLPEDDGYAQAALADAQRRFIFASGETEGAIADRSLPGDTYFGWYLIQGTSTETFLSQNPDNQIGQGPLAFFSLNSANPDQIEHLTRQLNGDYRWEDSVNIYDRDFNDAVFRYEFDPPSSGTNIAPVADPDKTLTLDEDSGPVALGIATPSDGDGDPLTITVTTIPDVSLGQVPRSDGTPIALGDMLSEAELTALQFVPLTDANGSAGSFGYTVEDGRGGSTTQTVGLAITPINDAPVLTLPGGQTTPGSTALAINGISVSDVDSASGELAVSLVVSDGVLSLSQTDGLTFTTGSGTGDRSLDFTGSLAAINAALETLTYQGDDGFAGSDALSIAVDDLGNQGQGGNLTDSGTLAIQVLPLIDNQPEATIDDVQIVEGQSGETIARFTVSLSAESPSTITLDYATPDDAQGTAQATVDYTPTAGTLTFNPGERQKTIEVIIAGDNLEEGNETFFVNLLNPVNATLADPQGTGTILDDDLPPTLAVDDLTIIEGDNTPRQAVFTVSLSAPSSFPITVDYATADGLATAGEDYLLTSGTLNFAPGETTQTVQVTILGDETSELSEAFELQLSDAVNATLADATGQATIQDNDFILLQEGTQFQTDYVYDFVVPSAPSILRFTYTPSFDTTDPEVINDAFEVALVDSNGQPLTHVIAPGRAAFFNLTEEQPADLAAGVSHDPINRIVSLNLTGRPAGTDASLVLRLVNNDSDTTTQVHLTNVTLEAAPAGTAPAVDSSPTSELLPASDQSAAALRDVSASVQARYAQSSFNPETGLLYAEVALENIGTYSLNGPLWVAVTRLSDPAIGVIDADGTTADGLPYYDFSHLVESGQFDPAVVTDSRSLIFSNPAQIQFTYDLVVLSALNQGPVIESDPVSEGILGQDYVYDVSATDADGDDLSYALLVAPDGMTIDATTGIIQWSPTNPDLGNHSVWLQVSDGRGGIAEQQFTVSVLEAPPNRPPIFTTDPVVDAFINQPYEYDADAVDPDGDALTYDVNLGPDGLTIDPDTGNVTWTPPSALILGDTVLGQISTPGEVDEFTFSGTAGQRIYLDPLRTSGGTTDLRLDVYSPNGEQIVTAGRFINSRDNKFLILPESGTYRITVDAADDHVGSYGFSLIDLSVVPFAPFDQPIEGTLSPGREDDVYRFRGAEGQKLFIDNISSGNPRSNWILYDENGATISQSSNFADMEIDQLPADGNYFLAIRGTANFTSAVDYRFEIITPDELTAPMALGSNETPNTVTGEISEKGEEDIYTFTGIAGQRILFDELSNNRSYSASIFDPVGTKILTHTLGFSTETPLILDRDGLYQVRIDAANETTGTYSFNVMDLGLATSINLDEVRQGALDPGQENHFYQFSGTSGQRLYLDTEGPFGSSDWALYDSGNHRLIGSSLTSDMEVVLDDTDTYTLRLEGNNNISISAPAAYDIQVITPDVHTDSLTYNATISGEITEKGERDVYTFSGTQGQRLFLDTLDSRSDFKVTLTNPSNSQTGLIDTGFASDQNRAPFILPETGDYELLIDGDGDATGSYRFRLVDVNNADTLQPETLTPGTLAPDHSITFYQLTANAGDRLYFDSQNAAGNVNWHLYSTSNNEIYETAFSNDFEEIIQGDGTYYLMLRSEANEPIDYTIQLVPTTAAPTPVAYTLGTTVNDSISKLGEQDVYSVELTAGQRLYWDAQGSNSNIEVTLTGVNGTLFAGDSRQDRTEIFVQESGTYQLTVDGNGSAVDAYQFRLLDMAAQPTLPFGIALSGTLAAYTTELYQFMGTKGQQISFDSLMGASSGDWILYGPGDQISNNWTVGSASLANDFTRALAADGLYTLALRNTSANAVSYSIQVDDVSTAPIPESGLDTVFSGSIVAGETIDAPDQFNFNANAGTLVLLDSLLNSNGSIVGRLSAPDGTVLFTQSLSSNRTPFLLERTGTYTFEVYGTNSNDLGNYQAQFLSLENAASLSKDTQTSLTLAPWETQVIRFTGAEGEKIWFDGLNTSNPGITASLYNPNGHLVWTRNGLEADEPLRTLTQDGDYYLVLSSGQTTARTATFQVLSNANATPLTLNQEISGNFGSSRREAHLYEFTGTAGQRVYFDRTSGSRFNRWQLYGPDGRSVTGSASALDRDFEVILPSDGNYLLSLYSFGSGDSSYRFTAITPDDQSVSITLDQVVNGEIREPGQQDRYTFDATAGQNLFFDSLENAPFNIRWKLISPSGYEVFGPTLQSARDNQQQVLQETGTYTLEIDGFQDETGSYSFRIFDWDAALAAATATVNLDDTLSGDFGSSRNETHLYQFFGTEGQAIYFDSRAGGNQNNRWDIFDLSGNPITGNNNLQRLDSDIELKLPYTGNYVIQLSGDGDSNNLYTIDLVTPELITTPYTLDTVIDTSISEPGEVDHYTFNGTPGQTILFDSLFNASRDIEISLKAPSGRRLINSRVPRGDYFQILDELGTYTIEIDAVDDTIGDYSFNLFDWDDVRSKPENQIALDTVVEGDFGANKEETHLYTFTGTEGQVLYFDRTIGNQSNQWELYGNQNQQIQIFNSNYLFPNANSQGLSSDFGAILPYTGDYTIALRGYGHGVGDLDYQFQVVTPEWTVTPYSPGTAVNTAIGEAGEKDIYTFEGKEGQQLYFDSLANTLGLIDWTLTSPSGNAVFGTNGLDARNDRYQVLPEDGTYTLEIDATNDTVDSYGFQIFDWAETATTIDLQQVVTDSFDPSPYETKLYRFTGETGQPLLFDRTAGGNGSYWQLFNEDRNPISPRTRLDQDLELILPETGEYTLELNGENVFNTDYSFEIVPSDWTTQALSLGSVIEGEIAVRGERDRYTFEGIAGQQLYFDGLSGDSDLVVSLYSPSGVEVFNREDARFDLAPLTLTEVGTYELVIDGNNTAVGQYSFRLSDRADVTPLPLGTATSGTLESTESHLYQFNGNRGTRLSFDLEADRWVNADWRLYDPNNNAIAAPSGSEPDFSVALPSDGLYTLAIQGRGNLVLDYSFTVTDETVAPIAHSGFNTPITAVVSAAGDTDTYSFDASAGTLIWLDQLSTTTGNIRANLLNPDGSVARSNIVSSNDIELLRLDQTGTYTLETYGTGNTTGNWAFQLLELPSSTADDNYNAIEPGAVVQGTLSPGHSSKIYSFEGNIGQQILFNGMVGSSVGAWLYDPNGQPIYQSGNFNSRDSSLYTLSQDGLYHLVIDGASTSATSDYAFQVMDFNASQKVRFNRPRQESLDSQQEMQLFSFQGEAGQQLFFDLDTAGNRNLKFQLYGPGNQTRLVNQSLRTTRGWDFTLPETGQYTIAIGSDVTASALEYTLNIVSHAKAFSDNVLVPGTGETASQDDSSLGLFPVQLSVDDGQGGEALQDFTLRLWPDPDNANPTITSTPVTRYGLNQPIYRYQVSATDPDSDPISYRLVDAPLGALIDQDTGELLWVPDDVAAGETYDFTVEALDPNGGSDIQTFELETYQALGQIQGLVWEDLNANGYRDSNLVQGDNPYVVFAIDISGSTGENGVDWRTTEVEDAITPGLGVLGMEIATALTLSEQLIEQGKGDTAQIGLVTFNHRAFATDFDRTTPGPQYFITPLTDNDGNGVQDLRENLLLSSDGFTNFNRPLLSAYSLLSDVPGDPNLIFLSDGVGSVGQTVIDQLNAAGVNMTAFGIGGRNVNGALRRIDPDAIGIADPREVTHIFGGWDSRYAAEPAMENVTVYLDLNNNGQLDADEPLQVTGAREDAFGDLPYQFVFDNLLPGDYMVRQVVPNGYEETAPSTGSFMDTITVAGGETFSYMFGNQLISPEPNQDPDFVTLAPTEAVEAGGTFKYDARAFDADADRLTYELTLAPDNMAVDGETGVLVWQPTDDQIGIHSVMLRVSDGEGGFDLQYFEVVVERPNIAPVFTSTTDVDPQVGKPFQYQAIAQDDDGDALSYRLIDPPAGVSIDSATGIVTWTPSATGQYELDIEADDGRGGLAQQQIALTVIETQANTTPDITSTPRVNTAIGVTYAYQVEATDIDGDPLTYELLQAPTGMAIDDQGTVIWTPTADQFGEHTVEVNVSDGQGGTQVQRFTLTASNQASNSAPAINSAPNTVTNLDRLYRYDLSASDPDGDPVAWQLIEAPSGMVIDRDRGQLSWQPTATQLGEHSVIVEVRDPAGLGTRQQFTLTVTGNNTPPAIVSTPITRAAQAQGYRYQVVATDKENDSLSYSLGAHPTGMTIDEETGLITWTPTTAQLGEQSVDVVVRDRQNGVQRQTYTVVVDAQALNTAPSITSNPVFVADVNGSYAYTVEATDPDPGDRLTYELIDGPTDMTIDPTTGLVEWTTPVAGSYRVVIGAVDSAGLGTAQGYTLTALANQAPTIRSTPVLTAIPNAAYTYDIHAADPEGGPLTYSLDALSESKGIQLDDQGRLSWTPTGDDVGSHTVTLTVSDNLGATTQQVYDLNVSADTEAPVVQLISTLNPADLGSEVSFQVRATDNLGVTGVELFLDGTPLTLNGNGVATVTLEQAGVVNLVGTAYDAAGNVGNATLDVQVLDAADSQAPQVSLDMINNGEPITSFTDLVGSVSDDNLLYYSLSIAPLGSDEFTEFYRGTETVDTDTLGTLDPTLLQNDAYTVRLTAEDTGGNVTFVDEIVNITGDLKLGNFTLSFTDMELPVSGIPVTVTRTYDSLTVNETDDFGYGWRLEFRDTNLRTTVGNDDPLYDQYGIRSLAFSAGDRVYLTLPGGKREGFTFEPKQVEQIDGVPLGLFSKRFFEPVFVADDGSENTLTVKNTLITQGDDGRFFDFAQEPYNPADPRFGGTYVLTTKEGIEYEIDAVSGDLLTATDLNDNRVTFDEGGIYSDQGTQITFGRDAQGRIISATDTLGQQVTYGYDDNGDLISVTDREGHTTRFDYSDEFDHYLDEVIDPLGRSGVKSEYDDQGRLKQLVDVNGEAVELIYDPDNSIQTVEDVFGNATTYVYDNRGNVLTEIDPVGKETRRSYDDDDNVLTETVITDESGPEGWTTTYTYDDERNQTSRTDALGNTEYYNYNHLGQLLSRTDSLGNTTNYSFDERGNVLSKTDAAGNTTTYTYDEFGNALTIESGPDDITRYGYDRFGNRTQKVDALGNETTYTYDANGNLQTETMTLTTTDGVRTLTTTRTYDTNGNQTSVLDPEGNLTQYEYDANGNQTAIIDALGRRTIMRYDDKNNLIETILPDDTPDDLSDNLRQGTTYDAAGRRTAITDADGRATTYGYDALDRPTGMVLADDTPNDDTDNPRIIVEYDQAGRMTALVSESGTRTEYEYDAVGRIIGAETLDSGTAQSTTSTFDAEGRELTRTDALGRTTEFEYDALGQRTATIYPDGTRTQTTYDDAGNVIAETDALGRTTQFEYDALDRLTAVIDALGQRTIYGYDEAGNLITQTDALGQITQFEYDGLGRMVATVRPLGQRSETEYDAVGRIIKTTDFNGEVITYAYNDLNQLTQKTLVNDGVTIDFSYSDGGKRESVTDERGTTLYDYDAQGRLRSRTEPDGASVAYTYYPSGQVETVTTPSGVSTYEYTDLNQLFKVIAPNGDETTYTYDEVDNLTQTVRPNGTVQTYEYNDLNQLAYLESKDEAGNVLASYRYTYDKVGNKTSVEELGGRQVEYTYDELYRLVEEKITDPVEGNRTIAYTFDEVGNRLTKDDSVDGLTTYDYDKNDRLLSETTAGVTTTYTYDDNGNLLSEVSPDQQVVYTWSDDNRLLGATITDADGTQQVEYSYDADGVRVAKTVDGDETRYLIDANRQYAQVLEEYDANGTDASYVYGNELISQERGGESSFYLYDGHSGTRQLTDAAGAVTDSYLYDAYGNVLKRIGDTENSYLYRGEQSDSETGLQYLRARYNDFETGRFISTDPFEGMTNVPMSRHRYLYGLNSPIRYTDPSGQTPLVEAVAALALRGILANSAFNLGFGIGSSILQRVNGSVNWSGALGLVDYRLPTSGPSTLSAYEAGVLGFSLKSESVNGLVTEGVWIVPALELAVVDFDMNRNPDVPSGSLGFLVAGPVNVSTPRHLGIGQGVLSGNFASFDIVYTSPILLGADLGAFTMGYGTGYLGTIGAVGMEREIGLTAGLSIPVWGRTRISQNTPSE